MKVEIGSHQSAVISEPGSGGVRSEMLGSSELLVSRGGFSSQDFGGEMLMRLKCPEFWQPSRQVSRRRDPRESGALVLGWRPDRVNGFLCWANLGLRWSDSPACAGPGFHIRGLQPPGGLRPAVPLRAGHRPAPYLKLRARLRPAPTWTGVSLLRQRAEIRGQRSESGCGFDPQDVGGEMLMSRDCPEIGRGAGGGGRGVKALPMHRERSARPGGLRGGLEPAEHPWGLRRRASEAAGGWRLPPWRRLPNLHGVLRCQEVCPSQGQGPTCTQLKNSGISRMGFEVLAVRCSGRMCNAD